MKTKTSLNHETPPAENVLLGVVRVSVWCDKFPENEVGLRFIWMDVPAYEVPKVGDVLCLENWDNGLEDTYYKVKLREFVFVDTNKFDSIRLIVNPNYA